MSQFQYKCCVNLCLIIKHYIANSTFKLQDTVQYCQSIGITFILTSISIKHYSFVSHTHFCPWACPASSPDLMPLKYLFIHSFIYIYIYIYIYRHLRLIFDFDFYSLSEFRGQGKTTLKSLALCLTKVFCTCVGSGLTTFQKKKKRLFHAPRD